MDHGWWMFTRLSVCSVLVVSLQFLIFNLCCILELNAVAVSALWIFGPDPDFGLCNLARSSRTLLV